MSALSFFWGGAPGPELACVSTLQSLLHPKPLMETAEAEPQTLSSGMTALAKLNKCCLWSCFPGMWVNSEQWTGFADQKDGVFRELWGDPTFPGYTPTPGGYFPAFPRVPEALSGNIDHRSVDRDTAACLAGSGDDPQTLFPLLSLRLAGCWSLGSTWEPYTEDWPLQTSPFRDSTLYDWANTFLCVESPWLGGLAVQQ